MDNLVSTYEKVKKLNEVLIDELESLHSNTVNFQSNEAIKETAVSEEQETVEKGFEDDVMILCTKQGPIEEGISFVGVKSTTEESQHNFFNHKDLSRFISKRHLSRALEVTFFDVTRQLQLR